MAKRSRASDVRREEGGWSADHPAVWVERTVGADGGPVVAMLRHISYPFFGSAVATQLESELRRIAVDYIDRVRFVARIGEDVVAALRNDDARPGFGWLPWRWANDRARESKRDPRGSFEVVRVEPRTGAIIDRTVVLLAGYRLKDNTSAGGEVGLRVVMHLGPGFAGRHAVRITGLSMSNLPRTLGDFRSLEAKINFTNLLLLHFGFVKLSVQGFVPIEPARADGVRLFGQGRRRRPDGTSSVVAFVGEAGTDGAGLRTRALLELRSGADPTAFCADPPSVAPSAAAPERKVTRSRERLEPFRVPTTRLVSPLRRPGGALEVRETPIANPDGRPGDVQAVDLAELPLRSDALAAAHAYLRGDEFLQRLESYGLPKEDYFKLAKLPLVMRHRASLRGARAGNTVNAQVEPSDVGVSLTELPGPRGDGRPRIEVSFAAANLRRRDLVEATSGRVRAQPMGLAADRRWAWHEVGHVINYSSFGKLEFRFAHSAGDALAALVADPDSSFASDPEARYRTFPWVRVGRRHDREAVRGWSCCGRRNLARLQAANALDDRRHGYFEEQLLSSALFRLYLSVGGLTADLAVRRSASDYVVYLIFTAVALFGPSDCVPARTIDNFVSALMDADTRTGEWSVEAAWPENEPARTLYRVGGCVHKVVRWAFERQGLYATVDPLETVDAIGLPPPVDIYIGDSRPNADGGYEPVGLVWSDAVDQPWHASADGIALRNGKLVVKVRNRGSLTAEDVEVGCWLWPVATPLMPAAPWPAATLASLSPQDIPAGSAAEFEFAAPPSTPPARYFVFAAATCDADRSNIDPASGQPCATLATPLVDLIANDNNLGLRILSL